MARDISVHKNAGVCRTFNVKVKHLGFSNSFFLLWHFWDLMFSHYQIALALINGWERNVLCYLLVLFEVSRQKLTTFCRQVFSPSENSIVHLVGASHVFAQTVTALQPEGEFSFGGLWEVISVMGPPCSMYRVCPTHLQTHFPLSLLP